MSSARTEWEIQHLAKEMSKWWWRKYSIRHSDIPTHWTRADWYKYRKGPKGRLLEPSHRAAYRNLILRSSQSEVSSADRKIDEREFADFLKKEQLRLGPSIPEYPVLDWLAKSIFRWYWPALWTVDMQAPDWLFQIRNADRLKAFSFAECEAHARRSRIEIGPVERLFLRVVTREGVTRDVRRIIGDGVPERPPYVLEGFHNPRIIPSVELCRSLAMSKAEAKARRRLTRDELASSRPRHRPGRRFLTPSGRIKQRFLRKLEER